MNTLRELEIKVCTPADYEDIAAIYNTYTLQSGYSMDMETKTADTIRKWVEGFYKREALYVLKHRSQSVAGSTVIGWGVIKRYSDREGYRFACETSVFLKEEVRGKGYGSYLKRVLIEKCRELGYHHLVAKIWASNTVSIEYNKKLGYEIVGTQREIGFRDGKWVDVVIMQYVF